MLAALCKAVRSSEARFSHSAAGEFSQKAAAGAEWHSGHGKEERECFLWASKTLQGVAVAPSVRVPGATIVRILENGEHGHQTVTVKLYVPPVVYTKVPDAVQFQGEASMATTSLATADPSRQKQICCSGL